MALLIAIFLVLPSMNWSAIRKPGQMENRLAGLSLPLVGSATMPRRSPTFCLQPPENLKAGQDDFDEHCSGCHGLDGSGENRFEADFYPPIPKLTGDTQKWSDGELYFIIANGISMTGMPAFGKRATTRKRSR